MAGFASGKAALQVDRPRTRRNQQLSGPDPGRRRHAGDGTVLDVKYMPRDAEDDGDLVRLCYGDSAVWVAFQEGRQKRVPVLLGMLTLFLRGLKRSLAMARRGPLRQTGRNCRGRPPEPAGPALRSVLNRGTMIMVNRMKAAQVALLIGLGAALHPAPAVGAEQSATELKVIPLRTVDNQGGQLELRGQAGQLQFRVPVEAGAKVRDARLRLVYQSADAVRSERSRMWVYLNQQSIAQLPLTSGGDAVRADIVLPPDLLTAGHNTLSLWAQQEGGRGCDADSSAALWTRLDPGNSYLALETAGPDRERNLADLADAASFIGAGSERIELLTPTSPTEGALKAGALVAQGFALRMPDSGIAVRHRLADAQALAGRNGKVVVGTADKIRGIPGISDLPDVQGPYIGLRPIQGAGPVLIVSGRTDAEVLKAASAFADPSVALPAAMDWNVDAVRPAVPWKRTMQEPGKSYRFKELRAISGGISNGTEARTGLELNLPADTLPAGGRKVLLELDYTYAQNLAPNSVVNVLVNGNYASMIALNDPARRKCGQTPRPAAGRPLPSGHEHDRFRTDDRQRQLHRLSGPPRRRPEHRDLRRQHDHDPGNGPCRLPARPPALRLGRLPLCRHHRSPRRVPAQLRGSADRFRQRHHRRSLDAAGQTGSDGGSSHRQLRHRAESRLPGRCADDRPHRQPGRQDRRRSAARRPPRP